MKYIILVAALVFTGCSSDKDTAEGQKPVHHKGTVLEIIPAAGYIYLNIEEGDSTFWISTTDTWVKPGAEVTFLEDIWMENFKSEVLDRSFDKILFAQAVSVTNPGELDKDKQHVSDMDVSTVEDAGVVTIADLFTRKQEFAGKKVTILGNAVKVSENILDNNWVHVTDGTEGEGHSTVIFASPDQTITAGQNVIASGIVTLDKDLGFGYFYEVLIENATFVVSEE